MRSTSSSCVYTKRSMMSETAPSNRLDGQTGELKQDEAATQYTETENDDQKNSKIANGDAAASEKLKTSTNQQTVLPPLDIVGASAGVTRDEEEDVMEAGKVKGNGDVRTKDAEDGVDQEVSVLNDMDELKEAGAVNGDIIAPLAEQEQEDEDLSSVEEQLELDDADWPDSIADEDDDCDSADESGSDFEDIPYPSSYLERDTDLDLPDTVTTLTSPEDCKVYLVGTAHFSHTSQDDVAKTIASTQPDIVMVELCKSRVNILHMDEELILKEAQDMSFEKIRLAIRQSGLLQGIMHLLLLSMSAHLTKELGMAPGGEFRRAFQEAQNIHGCRIHLGDRPISITLSRALGSLSVWQKARLAWHILLSKESITKEDVERCKQKDLLEEMLREMTGEFPALSEVFVAERDLFLANSLRLAARPVPHPTLGEVPSVVVGVVGIGHVPGIVEHWDSPINIDHLLTVPPKSYIGGALKWGVKAALVGFISWGCYKVIRLSTSYVL